MISRSYNWGGINSTVLTRDCATFTTPTFTPPDIHHPQCKMRHSPPPTFTTPDVHHPQCKLRHSCWWTKYFFSIKKVMFLILVPFWITITCNFLWAFSAKRSSWMWPVRHEKCGSNQERDYFALNLNIGWMLIWCVEGTEVAWQDDFPQNCLSHSPPT